MADTRAKLLQRCDNVLALYRHYRGLNLKVNRAEMRGDEVRADELDMVCDVEMAAKRALSLVDYLLFIRLSLTNPKLLSEAVRVKLGEAFKHLDESGDYRQLYYKAKNTKYRADADDIQRAGGEEPTLTHRLSDEVSDEDAASLLSATEPTFFVGQ